MLSRLEYSTWNSCSGDDFTIKRQQIDRTETSFFFSSLDIPSQRIFRYPISNAMNTIRTFSLSTSPLELGAAYFSPTQSRQRSSNSVHCNVSVYVCVCFYKCPQKFFYSFSSPFMYLFIWFFFSSIKFSYWNAEKTSGIRNRVKLTRVSHASPLYTRPSTVHPFHPEIQAISAARKSAFSSLKRTPPLWCINTTTL